MSLAYLRTLFTASCIALVIVACGGSDGNTDSTTDPVADDPAANQPVSQEVLGPDIDSDGIRDDVQMLIESEFSGDIEVMRAFKRMAVSDRNVLANKHDANRLRELAEENLFASLCFLEMFVSEENPTRELDLYQALLYDSPERAEQLFLTDKVLVPIQREISSTIDYTQDFDFCN